MGATGYVSFALRRFNDTHQRRDGLLDFTNILSKAQIERLAEADEHELVREVQVGWIVKFELAQTDARSVQEYYADYSPLTASHFSLSLLPTPLHPSPHQRTIALYGDSPNTFASSSNVLPRHVEGLTALLLSLKKKPIIRFERMSSMAKKLGQEVLYHMTNNTELWDFRMGVTQPVLLILDRRNDPVTPLLSQWTYQAMVHELIGITNGRVDLSSAADVRDDMKVRSDLDLSTRCLPLNRRAGNRVVTGSRFILCVESLREFRRLGCPSFGLRIRLFQSISELERQ